MSEPIRINSLLKSRFNIDDKVNSDFDSDLRFADCLLCPHTLKPDGGKYGLKDGHCNGINMEEQTKIKETKCPIGRW
ncbi:MAG: hypothetical protein AAB638_00790 [Patescibacteria group bacterium]